MPYFNIFCASLLCRFTLRASLAIFLPRRPNADWEYFFHPTITALLVVSLILFSPRFTWPRDLASPLPLIPPIHPNLLGSLTHVVPCLINLDVFIKLETSRTGSARVRVWFFIFFFPLFQRFLPATGYDLLIGCSLQDDESHRRWSLASSRVYIYIHNK